MIDTVSQDKSNVSPDMMVLDWLLAADNCRRAVEMVPVPYIDAPLPVSDNVPVPVTVPVIVKVLAGVEESKVGDVKVLV